MSRTALSPMDAPAAAAPAAGRLRLPHGWAVYALFVGFPVWWLLGLAGFIWPVLAVPMLASLVVRRRAIRFPKGFGIWLLFLVWMIGSATQVTQFTRAITFGYRASLYLSATILFLFVYNADEDELSNRDALGALSLFWLFIVFGGYLGLVKPAGSFSTIAQKLMPGRFVSNAWVFQMVHPAFAQIHDFLGFPVGRPTAPFVYTNEWGSNMGLLIPLVVAGWFYIRRPGWRGVTFFAILLALVPIVVSLNRGLWLSLTIGIVYASWRFALRGRSRAFGAILVTLAVIGGLVMFTPLRALISDRLRVGHSNQARLTLDQEAIQGALAAPVLGYGSPLPSDNPHLPDIGTQGQLWLVLYSQGFPGAIFFVGWFAYAFWATRRASTPAQFWVHVMLLILLVQVPFYGFLPSSLHVAMMGAALGFREVVLERKRARLRTSPLALPEETSGGVPTPA